MLTYHQLYKSIFNTLPIILIALICPLCSSNKKISHPEIIRPKIIRHGRYRQQLIAADSMYRYGNYEIAKMKYTKVRDNCTNPDLAAYAQYRLGYIHIYYDNPFANYEAALREFKRFASMYPKDKKIELVHNWIRMLTALKNFAGDHYRKSENLKKMQMTEKDISKNYASLRNAYQGCETVRDSLITRIKILEGVIEELDKLE